MVSQQNKDLIGRFYAAVDAHRFEAAAAMLGQNFIVYIADNPPIRTRAEFVGMLEMFYSAFPDGRHEFREILADGPKVITSVIWSGTHQGAFQGVAPTGKRVQINIIHIDEITDGTITEHRGVADFMSLMQQLGAIPRPGPGT